MIYFDLCLCCLNYLDTSYIILHPFFPVFPTSCLKIEEYFDSLAVKTIYYKHLARVVFHRFLGSFLLILKGSTTWYLPIYILLALPWSRVEFVVLWLDQRIEVEELVSLVRRLAGYLF